MKHAVTIGALAFALAAAFQGCAQGSQPPPIDFSSDSGAGDGSGSGSGSGGSSGGGSPGSSGTGSSSGSGGSSSGADSAGSCGDLYQPCCAGAYCAATLTCSPNVVCVTAGQGDSGTDPDGGGVVDSGPTCAPGLSLCNGVCTDTSSNQANCGSCGHVCQFTTCTNGACDSVVLSSGFVPPGRLVIDASNAYWTNGDGTVRSVPLAGGTTTTLATGLSSPEGIAVDAQNVYATSQDGRIVSVPLAGSATPTVLATMQPRPYALAIDATNVYWTDARLGLIYRIAKG